MKIALLPWTARPPPSQTHYPVFTSMQYLLILFKSQRTSCLSHQLTEWQVHKQKGPVVTKISLGEAPHLNSQWRWDSMDAKAFNRVISAWKRTEWAETWQWKQLASLYAQGDWFQHPWWMPKCPDAQVPKLALWFPSLQIQPTMDTELFCHLQLVESTDASLQIQSVTVFLLGIKKSLVSQSVQFKPMWFKGQQYTSSLHLNRKTQCYTNTFLGVSSVRLVMSNSLGPHELQDARPPCPSPTLRIHSNSSPSSRWCHPAISSSVIPFSSCPQSLPASQSFPTSQLFAWGGQSTGVSALASHSFQRTPRADLL